MTKINLQQKTKAQKGDIEMYWFENANTGLKRTLFHRIEIPLKPFDSGLTYEPQPVETEIVMEWLKLNLNDPTNLDGLHLKSNSKEEAEVSVYVGNAHNPCSIKNISFKKIDNDLYQVQCHLFIDFEHEGVAKNEDFSFVTQLKCNTQIQDE